MSVPTVIVHRDPTVLTRAVAARLVTRLVDAQAAKGSASVVLTGGRVGTRTLVELATTPARDAIDWHRLDVWWGDERFLPTGHPERNETQATEALLSAVDVDPSRVHPMPASDGPFGADPENAAAGYAEELAKAARPEDHGPVPSFDVLLLGVGEDGHVASLFPEAPALYEQRPVVAVRGAPKAPPVRLTLTLPAICSARDVWVLGTGREKAAPVRMALSGAGAVQVPASGVAGRSRTLWLLDEGAATQLPTDMRRPAGR